MRYFKGQNLVIINKESTDYDKYAALVFHDGLGAVFTEAMKMFS